MKKIVIANSILVGLFTVALTATSGLGKGPGGGEEIVGNNLSFPVIWAEGISKTLPGTANAAPVLKGEWWYQWGTNGADPDITPASCVPDPDEANPELNPGALHLCDDGTPGQVDLDYGVAGTPPADNPLPLVRAYVQKDEDNIWQASSLFPDTADFPDKVVYIDAIDWGDNLESVDWYTKSKVRIEVVLFKDLNIPVTEYEMRHVSGWGIDEDHGIAVNVDNGQVSTGPGIQATVYSHCARLTIQKLLVDRGDASLDNLVWTVEDGQGQWSGTDNDNNVLINAPLFNASVYGAANDTDSYSAEINVKGRVIYGYTWDVESPNKGEGPGDYRITFSFDQTCGNEDVGFNAIIDSSTGIKLPLPVEIEAALSELETESTDGGGGEAVLDSGNNLTYIDVRILERSGGGGGGGGKSVTE